MGRLTQECLESLKQKVDLVELLSSYLEIKKAGAYYRAICPFHEERTPSFVIQPGSSHYHCFGCQAHGDAIAFLMHHQQLNFQEAVESLAERFQIPLEYEAGSEQKSNKSKYILALNQVQAFYHQTLLKTEEGKKALEYLNERGIDQDFIETFEIGLAPRVSASFFQVLKRHKIEDETLKELGLLSDSGRAFFFDRITFPIRDARGAVIGFSARLYHEGGGGGKYINSKESLLFKKSQVLFGLNYSRKRMAKNKRVLIVEGQIDALRLIQAGLNATVAPLGTALTESHVDKLLQLGIETAYLAFDPDEAGCNAAIKAGNLLQKKGITVYVVSLPEKTDPDLYLKQKGVEAFRQLLKENRDYLSFLMYLSSRRTDLSNPANKSRVVEKIAGEIKKWEHPVMVHESLKKLAQLSNLPESTLGINDLASPAIFNPTLSTRGSDGVDPNRFLETDVLSWLIQPHPKRKDYVKKALFNLSLEDFWDEDCLEIFNAFSKASTSTEHFDTLSLLSHLKKATAEKHFTDLIEKKLPPDPKEMLFNQSIQRLLDRNWMKKREEIKVKIQSGELSDQDALSLAKEFDQIQKNRPQVKSP